MMLLLIVLVLLSGLLPGVTHTNVELLFLTKMAEQFKYREGPLRTLPPVITLHTARASSSSGKQLTEKWKLPRLRSPQVENQRLQQRERGKDRPAIVCLSKAIGIRGVIGRVII
jgi:hypothetical protein